MKLFLEDLTLASFSTVVLLATVVFFPSYPAALGFVMVCALTYAEQDLKAKREIQEQKSYDSNIVSIQNQIDVLIKDHESVTKMAEETKKLLSQANIAQGFTRRTRQ